ncbi:MAG: DUF4058 family protein [Aphanocapsa sp. GSE-SYN-MK-11-07L]|jgi:hypothetical protein|nr:DUF4058 family protein [Aphanocapsa sp. GSE-SYN-MK-11-07L]
MPLLDHFRPPLSLRRHWHSFHNAWSTYLAEVLNQSLPDGYFAEPNAQFGIKIDVATLSETPLPDSVPRATAWTPRSPTATLPFQLTTDSVQVQIFSTQAGSILVGAIELVSPANKDRPTHRNAFTSKCQTYLQPTSLETELYGVAYRVGAKDGASRLDFWQEPLTLAEKLPTIPLCLKGGLFLPIDLEQTYHDTCKRQRIPDSL